MRFSDRSDEFTLLLYSSARSYIQERMPVAHQALEMLVAPEHFKNVDSSDASHHFANVRLDMFNRFSERVSCMHFLCVIIISHSDFFRVMVLHWESIHGSFAMPKQPKSIIFKGFLICLWKRAKILLCMKTSCRLSNLFVQFSLRSYSTICLNSIQFLLFSCRCYTTICLRSMHDLLLIVMSFHTTTCHLRTLFLDLWQTCKWPLMFTEM